MKSIERKIYTDKIKGFIDKRDLIKIITGIRRCGKSEILKLIREEVLKLTTEDKIVFINFEDIEFDFIKNYKDLYEYVLSKMVGEEKYYLFFDEIQVVDEWEKAVNSLRMRNTDIFITGSNSRLLSGELASLLGGRYVQFEIRPLSLKEFIDFRTAIPFGAMPLPDSDPSKKWMRDNDGFLHRIEVANEISEYIKLGGFPFISTQNLSLEQANQIVKDIHSSIVLKDVVSRNSITKVPLLEKIITYFYDNIGSLTSLRKIADYISGGDKRKSTTNLETIANYVSYLETAYILTKVPRYDIKGKKVFETNDKYYLADHSLAYVVKDISKVNKGGIIENIVHNELLARGYKIYVGKLDTKEINFIAEKNGEKIYVQACLEFTSQDTYNREFDPLKEIKDNYPKYVVSMDSNANKNDSGIIGMHLLDFLMKETL